LESHIIRFTHYQIHTYYLLPIVTYTHTYTHIHTHYQIHPYQITRLPITRLPITYYQITYYQITYYQITYYQITYYQITYCGHLLLESHIIRFTHYQIHTYHIHPTSNTPNIKYTHTKFESINGIRQVPTFRIPLFGDNYLVLEVF